MEQRSTLIALTATFLIVVGVLALTLDSPESVDATELAVEDNLDLVLRKAEEGDAYSQMYLGLKFATGEGVRQDDGEAVMWYRKAAEQGNAEAQHYLGLRYATGRGVPQDYAEAMKWWRKAADTGHVDAQYFFGSSYAEGTGVPQDYGEAVKWWRKAAEQGFAEAQYRLGLMYFAGAGVPQDFIEAYAWLNIAVARGVQIAVSPRDSLAKRLSAADLSQAQARAQEYFKKYPPRHDD